MAARNKAVSYTHLILGINHYRVAGNRIQEEWVTFDGLDVLKQIYLETEDSYVKTEDNMMEGER